MTTRGAASATSGVFEITGVGLPVAAIGIAVLVVWAPRALRHRHGVSGTDVATVQPYTIALRVDALGPLVGATVEEQGWDARPTVDATYTLLRDATSLLPGLIAPPERTKTSTNSFR